MNLRTAIVQNLSRRLMEELYPERNVRTDKILKYLLSHASSQTSTHQPDTPGYEYGLLRTVIDKEYFLASTNASRVINRVLVRLGDQSGESGELEIREIVGECIRAEDVPGWLHPRFLAHIPHLFFEDLSKTELSELSGCKLMPYTVYHGAKSHANCDGGDLRPYREIARKGDFDIFVEDTDEPHIFVRNDSKVFRAGRTRPLVILSYLLARVGQEVTYSELALRLTQVMDRPQKKGDSKRVYTWLYHIRKQLKKVDGVRAGDPEIWFECIRREAKVRVWRGINSCLIRQASCL